MIIFKNLIYKELFYINYSIEQISPTIIYTSLPTYLMLEQLYWILMLLKFFFPFILFN